jgi:hypothetical protein
MENIIEAIAIAIVAVWTAIQEIRHQLAKRKEKPTNGKTEGSTT